MYDTKELKLLRIKYNYTIKDMAKMLNMSPAFYCQIENKKRKLYYTVAIEIAKIFDTTPDNIFLTKHY